MLYQLILSFVTVFISSPFSSQNHFTGNQFCKNINFTHTSPGILRCRFETGYSCSQICPGFIKDVDLYVTLQILKVHETYAISTVTTLVSYHMMIHKIIFIMPWIVITFDHNYCKLICDILTFYLKPHSVILVKGARLNSRKGCHTSSLLTKVSKLIGDRVLRFLKQMFLYYQLDSYFPDKRNKEFVVMRSHLKIIAGRILFHLSRPYGQLKLAFGDRPECVMVLRIPLVLF